MLLGARTWYPAQDERNGIYQLQKAEERAASEHAEKLRRINRIRDIRLRRESCNGTPCGSAYNVLPEFFVPGVEHHLHCNAAGGKAMDSGSLPKPETFMPAAQPSAHGHPREDQMATQKGKFNSNAKHENSMHGPMPSQKKNEQPKNQGSTLPKQNWNTQNSNHQKKGDQNSFGNEQGGNQHEFSSQTNGNQNCSGVGQHNSQKSFGNQQSGKEQKFLNQQIGNQKIFGAGQESSLNSSGDRQSRKKDENFNQKLGNQKHSEFTQSSFQKSFGNQQQGDRQNNNQTSSGARKFEDHQKFGIQENLGNHQNRNQKIFEVQSNAGAHQKFAAHKGSFNANQVDGHRNDMSIEQQYLPRKEDRQEIHSRNSSDHFSTTKKEPRGANTSASLGIGHLNEDRNVRFSRGSKYPVIGKVDSSPPQKNLDDHGSFLPRVEPRLSRTSRDNMLEGSGDGWNRILGEPRHLRFQDHYDYLLGKEINRVLNLAGFYPDDASYGHRRSSFSGF